MISSDLVTPAAPPAARKRTRLTPAAGYVRMSTDQQEDSPKRQRMEIETIARRERCKIVVWYEDHGLTGTESENRPEFQKMLRDAKAGKFRAVVMHEQSRMSREKVLDAMSHWRLLDKAGVAIITSKRGKIDFDDMGGLITAIVEQHGAHEESRKIADRTIGGKKLAARNGQRIGGNAVFAYDRELHDDGGKLVRRIHFRERFQKPKSWTSRLVVSTDGKAVEGLRRGFRTVADGGRISAVVKDLNSRGITTIYGNRFDSSQVKRMLMNPVYMGTLRAGIYCRGKFRRLDEDGPIYCEDAHEGLVGKELFQRAQRVLRLREKHHERGEPGRYLLSTIVYCAHCGRVMYGAYGDTGGGKPECYYRCSDTHAQEDPDCPHPCIVAKWLEAYIIDQIRERLLTEENAEIFRRAIARRHESYKFETAEDERRLDEIRARIERGIENFCLADRKDVPAISALLAKWRKEKKALEDKIKAKRQEIPFDPEAAEIIAKLAVVRDRLGRADRVKLSYALKQVIKSITIGRRTIRGDKASYREIFGSIEFNPATGCDEVIEFTDTDIGPRKVWRKVADYVCAAGRPVLLPEIIEEFKFSQGAASCHLAKATLSGAIKRVGPRRGWIAANLPLSRQ